MNKNKRIKSETIDIKKKNTRNYKTMQNLKNKESRVDESNQ